MHFMNQNLIAIYGRGVNLISVYSYMLYLTYIQNRAFYEKSKQANIFLYWIFFFYFIEPKPISEKAQQEIYFSM